MNNRIVIELDENDVKAAHIQSLQDTLTKRNKRIEALEAQINAGEGSAYAKRQYELGYKHGWNASAGEMMEQTRQMARYLTETHESAFKVYLAGDKLTVAGGRVDR